METVASLLAKYREERGISSNALARAVNLSPSYMSLLLRGQKGASAQTLYAIATAFELTTQETEGLFAAAGFDETVLAALKRHAEVGTPGVDPQSAGIVVVRRELPEDLLEAWIRDAKECIRIQDTWIPDPGRLKKAFLEATKKGVRIEVLLLKDQSDLAKQRSLDLNQRTSSFVSERILDALHEFEQLNEEGVNIVVRLYESLPSVQQLICDQRRFIGFFAHGARSDLAPQLQIEGQDTFLIDFFDKEFARVWEASTQVIPKLADSTSVDQ